MGLRPAMLHFAQMYDTIYPAVKTKYQASGVEYMKILRIIIWIIICIVFSFGLLYMFTGSLELFPTAEQQEKAKITSLVMMIVPIFCGIALFATRKK